MLTRMRARLHTWAVSTTLVFIEQGAGSEELVIDVAGMSCVNACDWAFPLSMRVSWRVCAIVWRPAPDSSSPRTRQSGRRGSVALFGAQGGAAAKRAWAGPQGRNRVQIQGSDFNARKESKVVLTSIPMSDSSAFATPDVGVGSR